MLTDKFNNANENADLFYVIEACSVALYNLITLTNDFN